MREDQERRDQYPQSWPRSCFSKSSGSPISFVCLAGLALGRSALQRWIGDPDVGHVRTLEAVEAIPEEEEAPRGSTVKGESTSASSATSEGEVQAAWLRYASVLWSGTWWVGWGVHSWDGLGRDVEKAAWLVELMRSRLDLEV